MLCIGVNDMGHYIICYEFVMKKQYKKIIQI